MLAVPAVNHAGDPMGTHRHRFADEYEDRKAPAGVVFTRAIIASVLVGIAAAAHIIFGVRIF